MSGLPWDSPDADPIGDMHRVGEASRERYRLMGHPMTAETGDPTRSWCHCNAVRIGLACICPTPQDAPVPVDAPVEHFPWHPDVPRVGVFANFRDAIAEASFRAAITQRRWRVRYEPNNAWWDITEGGPHDR